MDARSQTVTGWGTSLVLWLITALLTASLYCWLVHPDLRFQHNSYTHGPNLRKQIALTFDDGPHPLWAPLLADTLQQYGAHGTFYLVGVEAQRYPEITTRLATAGHQIANHSLTHPYPNLTAFDEKRIRNEIDGGVKILNQITGQKIRDFRPPGGFVDDRVYAALSPNTRLDWWSVNTGDWSSPSPAVIAERLRNSERPGLVVLMHEREQSIPALEQFLAGSTHDGYTYTTFSSLMGH